MRYEIKKSTLKGMGNFSNTCVNKSVAGEKMCPRCMHELSGMQTMLSTVADTVCVCVTVCETVLLSEDLLDTHGRLRGGAKERRGTSISLI